MATTRNALNKTARLPAACSLATLARSRFGVGPTDAEVLIIGEGPGEQEVLGGAVVCVRAAP
jgi:uracil-DNA glycosylase